MLMAREAVERWFIGMVCGVLTALSGQALAAEPLTIGIVSPQSGNLEILGRQVLAGAGLAAQNGGAKTIAFDETCQEGAGIALAEALIAAKISVATGFLCTETLVSAMPRLKDAGIVAITLSVRSDFVMQDGLKKNWPLFRLAPTAGAERDRIVETIEKNWKDTAFAILDDGTINSRELAESVRTALEEKGMKAGLVDTFRPAQDVQLALIRRLAKAGITHALVTGDRSDMAVIARDAKAQNREFIFLGGDQLKGGDQSVALEPGVLAVTLADRPSGSKTLATIDALARSGIATEGYVLPGFASVTMALEAKDIAAASGVTIAEVLVDTPFDTAMGPLRFNAAHELAINPFTLTRWNGSDFEPVAPASGSN